MTNARRRSLLISFVVVLTVALPTSIVGAAGQRNLEGVLRVAHGENFGTNQEYWDYHLQTAQGTYRLEFGGEGPEEFRNGAHVRVQGTPDARGVVALNASASTNQVLAVAAAPTSSAKKLALVLVNFVANPTEPWTLETAGQRMYTDNNSVANYFNEESYGYMTVSGDVFGYFTIDYNTATCNYTDLATKAKAAAAAAGVSLAGYTNVQYAFPYVSSCGWSGLAYLPGTESWLNNALSLRVSAHELSHNFGVHHASTIDCSESGVRVALSANTANCTVSEYGDPFSIMGSAQTRHTHNQQLASLGWIASSELVTVSTAGTYALGSVEDPSATPKALRVNRGNGTYIYLELRQPWGSYFDNFGSADAVVNGVSVRISSDWTTITQSKLVDTTPATTSFLDSAVAVGYSFLDPVSGVTITTVSVAGGVAMVSVSWAPDGTPPTAPAWVSVASTGATTATVSWAASTDNLAVGGYEVTRDGTYLGSRTTTSYPDGGLVGGQSYLYTVTAYDAAGNYSAATSYGWTQPIPDTTKPAAPTNLRATSVTKSKISLAWNASTDNVGVVGYRIYRNGALWATTSGLTYTGTRSNKVYTYTVMAYDAAGNVSLASIALSR